MDFYRLLGYISGILFIKPDMDSTAIVHTAALVHFLDAVLCWVIANYSGRNKTLWAVAGALGGFWALATLFLLPEKRR